MQIIIVAVAALVGFVIFAIAGFFWGDYMKNYIKGKLEKKKLKGYILPPAVYQHTQTIQEKLRYASTLEALISAVCYLVTAVSYLEKGAVILIRHSGGREERFHPRCSFETKSLTTKK